MLNLVAKIGFALGISVFLSGCFDPAQEEILSKVKGLNSPDDIVAAIGSANKIVNDGALQHWRYSASGGDVCFSVVGKLAMRMIC